MNVCARLDSRRHVVQSGAHRIAPRPPAQSGRLVDLRTKVSLGSWAPEKLGGYVISSRAVKAILLIGQRRRNRA